MKHSDVFKSIKMWAGFWIMLSSVALALVSYAIGRATEGSFHWFSASGAVMVTGSILFERLQPGTSLGGAISFSSLPSLNEHDAMKSRDKWLMANGGRISIVVLIFGTLIWAYGPLIV
jgi:hypothetical protein